MSSNTARHSSIPQSPCSGDGLRILIPSKYPDSLREEGSINLELRCHHFIPSFMHHFSLLPSYLSLSPPYSVTRYEKLTSSFLLQLLVLPECLS